MTERRTVTVDRLKYLELRYGPHHTKCEDPQCELCNERERRNHPPERSIAREDYERRMKEMMSDEKLLEALLNKIECVAEGRDHTPEHFVIRNISENETDKRLFQELKRRLGV